MMQTYHTTAILRRALLRLPTSRFVSSGLAGTDNHYDIIVAGGGMVGSTLACTLGKNPKLSQKRILLLEASKPLNWKPTEKYSNRVVALNPSTRVLFDKIGVWKHIEAVRYGPVHKLQVWDALSNSMIEFNNDNDSENVAYIVENNLILYAVDVENKLLSNVNIVNEARIKSCSLPMEIDANVSVELENGKVYTCELLLGCDGVKSKIRDAMAVQYLDWDYNQMGLVATLELSEETDENTTAWQRFLPTGPIALLPLNKKYSSLVWSNSPENVKNLIKLPADQFIDEVNGAIWKVYEKSNVINSASRVVDNILKVFDAPPNCMRQLPPSVIRVEENSRAAFPLGFGHASNYIRSGVALVGDAAHRVHPLGGQGVNLGFGDIVCINDILSEAVYSGRKLGNLLDLKIYETERQRHNVPTMFALDGLHKLYTTDFTPIVLLRSLGLQVTHALTPVKKAIMQQAAY